jgi:hypothetical protein
MIAKSIHHRPPEKQDAQTVDNQRNHPVLFLGSLLPVGRGWSANKSLAFERSGGIAKRVWLCGVEPKAGRPNAWEKHESTEPSMNCAKRIVRLTRDGSFRRRSRLRCVTTRQVAMARQASSAIAEDVIRLACLYLDVRPQFVS